MQCYGPLLPCADIFREWRARLGARGRARGAPRRVVCRGGALGEGQTRTAQEHCRERAAAGGRGGRGGRRRRRPRGEPARAHRLPERPLRVRRPPRREEAQAALPVLDAPVDPRARAAAGRRRRVGRRRDGPKMREAARAVPRDRQAGGLCGPGRPGAESVLCARRRVGEAVRGVARSDPRVARARPARLLARIREAGLQPGQRRAPRRAHLHGRARRPLRRPRHVARRARS